MVGDCFWSPLHKCYCASNELCLSDLQKEEGSGRRRNALLYLRLYVPCIWYSTVVAGFSFIRISTSIINVKIVSILHLWKLAWMFVPSGLVQIPPWPTRMNCTQQLLIFGEIHLIPFSTNPNLMQKLCSGTHSNNGTKFQRKEITLQLLCHSVLQDQVFALCALPLLPSSAVTIRRRLGTFAFHFWLTTAVCFIHVWHTLAILTIVCLEQANLMTHYLRGEGGV